MGSRSAAVVTGAGNGLGLGLARALAARGMSVVMADINEAALHRAADLLRQDGADVLAVRTDVTKQASVDELAGSIPQNFGQVEVVCLNAGVSMRGETWSLSLDDWRWIYDVNVFGVVHGIRSFVPALMDRAAGHVVITSSNTAVSTVPALAAYVSSKHAVLSIAESLQHDLLLAGSTVRASVALPSAIRSAMADAVTNRPPDYHGADVPDDIRKASREFLERYGADPSAMADDVLRAALDDNQFCIFTDAEDRSRLADRASALSAGLLPGVSAPVLDD